MVLLLFGTSRLPKLARSMGEASKEFRKGVHEGSNPEVGPAADASVTMSQAELDAMLARARAQGSKDEPPAGL